jgi:hypothetical protein
MPPKASQSLSVASEGVARGSSRLEQAYQQ